ncbi:5141_t:CDS:2 [Entrophospora sp. SA101]|nr:5141_t:CDS:2 [Entrophospora sp. SA101]
MNPLHNVTTLEQPHLNDYVHPCLKAALWYCTEVHYTLTKEIGDKIKIARNLKKMFFDIVKDRVEKRKAMIPEMEVFGAASVKLNIHIYVLGFAEIDNAAVPRDFSEMEEFIIFTKQF